jgi:hypothetical protein
MHGNFMNDLLFVVEMFMLLKWSYRSLPIMLTIEPRMVSMFYAHSPIPFKHMFVWCMFLVPHLTTLANILDLGTSTLTPYL